MRYLLAALLLALLVAPVAAQEGVPSPVVPDTLHLEADAEGMAVAWTAADAGYGWTVRHNGVAIWHSAAIGAGAAVRVPLPGHVAGDRVRVCATRESLVACLDAGAHRVVLPLLHG